MPIITLTTDLGNEDYYLGAVKGALLSAIPNVQIIDITNNIKVYDIKKAAFVLKNVYKDYPSGTIHILGMQPDKTNNYSSLIIYHNEQYFIGPNNGAFSLIFDTKPTEIYEFNYDLYPNSYCFPVKNLYAKVAAHIANGGHPNKIANPVYEYNELLMFNAISEPYLIKGLVNYIDHYGNAITNISKNLFDQYQLPRFQIYFRGKEYSLNKISKHYDDVSESSVLALFNSTGFLELAMNKGNFSKLCGINLNDSIRIEFYD
ncbi:MAG: SAM-dependent chlorinase/fluorinase [Vicingaceae bacterium]